MRVFDTLDEVVRAAGTELGVSAWQEITQERVNLFAEATGDHQWIHVDPERAAEGPFGGPIAHGYLTLSMVTTMANELLSYAFSPVRVNYGLERVRFVTPVRVGARIRNRVVIEAVEQVPAGTRVTFAHTVEIDGESRPACVAATVSLLVV